MESNWHKRFKAMKSGLGMKNADIAEIIGNTPDSVRSVTQPNRDIPRWLKLAIVVYEKMSEQTGHLNG
jgi:hypothetical protein